MKIYKRVKERQHKALDRQTIDAEPALGVGRITPGLFSSSFYFDVPRKGIAKCRERALFWRQSGKWVA